MSRAEQVARVLSATVTTEYDEDLVTTTPLIAAGDELYFFTTEQVERFVRRILAAADGTTEFIDRPRPTLPPVRARWYGARRNPEGAAAYAQHKRERRH